MMTIKKLCNPAHFYHANYMSPSKNQQRVMASINCFPVAVVDATRRKCILRYHRNIVGTAVVSIVK